MTTLLWQTALLLLAAYFLGAWLACLIRRTFFWHETDERLVHETAFQPHEAQPAVVAAIPEQPTEASTPSNRFERALVGDPNASVAASRNADVSQRVEAIQAIARAVQPAAGAVGIATATTASAAAAAVAPQTNTSDEPTSTAALVVHSGSADDLQNIQGIDAETLEFLKNNGVKTYAAIAGFDAEDVEGCEEALGEPGRVSQQNWIEQAHILVAGRLTMFAERRAQEGISSQPPPLPARSQATFDVSGRASLDDSALILDTVASEATPEGGYDDLKRIRGIGVLIEKRLNSIGITRYEQIASWTASDIARIGNVIEFRDRIEREDWIGQARILASGGITQFASRRTSST